MRKYVFGIAASLIFISITTESTAQQQYKLRQVNNTMGMKSESLIYVKGMRKRTEGGGVMGMTTPTTIQQCDLQRTIKINDKKKLYYIEPFSNEPEEMIDEDQKNPPPVKTKPVVPTSNTQKGGIIYMYYNITDTGERKKMYGFTARHIWTTQKMKPSADACMMKDSMIIKTDGWYIDLPEFNCPIRYRPERSSMQRPQTQQPDCMDKFVSKRSGKGKLGFILEEKRTIIMGGRAETSNIETSVETLEFTTAKLDSMLFEIPPGYTETKNEADLQDKFDMNAMIDQYKNANPNTIQQVMNGNNNNNANEKRPGVIRIGVYEPQNEGQLQSADLQHYLAGILIGDKIEAIPVSSEEEAKSKKCDYSLATNFTKVKQASKVGGLLKAIKNSDPNAASSFNMSSDITLKNLGDGSVRLQQTIDGKYDGKVDDAAKRVLDEESRLVLKSLK